MFRVTTPKGTAFEEPTAEAARKKALVVALMLTGASPDAACEAWVRMSRGDRVTVWAALQLAGWRMHRVAS